MKAMLSSFADMHCEIQVIKFITAFIFDIAAAFDTQ